MQESETVEFKKSLAERKEGLVSMAAILNKHGRGELWFGIKNDGTPMGLQVTEKTLRDVSQAIAAHIEPKVYPTVSEEKVAGKSCLKVAFQGGECPYYAFGRAYMRVSDADHQLSAVELERLILEKNRSHRRWDSEKCGLVVEDLSVEAIRAFVERAGLQWSTVEAALENLGLSQAGHLVNAASVFFQKDPPHELRTAVFAGTTSATILDQQSHKGGILELIEASQRYILRNIHIGMRVEGLERIDVPEIHPEAIREAVINAFCHRDYRDPDPVQVAIYQDRVEIRNPGTLIEGMTLEDLRRGTVSRRRNPIIAELLRRIRLIESWGRGIPLILEKAPSARFSIEAGLFVSALQRSWELTGKTAIASEKSPEAVSVATQKTTRETTQKTSSTTQKILDILETTPTASRREIAETLGDITEDGVKYHLEKLKRSGRIQRIGPDKGGHWKILDPKSTE